MADNLPDIIENQLLDALVGTSTYSITGATKLRLMTANGSDASAGTEVTGGSYVAQTIAFTTASSGAMPAATVVGIEIYDSAGSPKRLLYGALTSPRTVTAGDTVQFASGAIDITLS